MHRRIFGGAAALVFLAGVIVSGTAKADSTSVLPKGRSAVSLFYFNDRIVREFDDSGSDREEGYFLNNTDVTAFAEGFIQAQYGPFPFNVFRDVTTMLDAAVDIEGAGFSYQYGVTDKLSVGVGFPYYVRSSVVVDFDIGVQFSNTAVALLPPALLAGLQAQRKQLSQQFLNQLGYEDLDNFNEANAIGDIRLGAKYLFYDGDMIKGAGALWGTVPTGRADDERNLTDVPYGLGNYTTGLALMADFTPVELVTLNATAKYVVNWPYHRGVFILDKDNPAFYKAEFETLHLFGDYDRGDYYELEGELRLNLARGVHAWGGWRYTQQASDYIDDDEIPKSDTIQNTLLLGLTGSAAQAYAAGESKAPVSFSIYTEAVQSGKNVSKTSPVFASFTLYF